MLSELDEQALGSTCEAQFGEQPGLHVVLPGRVQWTQDGLGSPVPRGRVTLAWSEELHGPLLTWTCCAL